MPWKFGDHCLLPVLKALSIVVVWLFEPLSSKIKSTKCLVWAIHENLLPWKIYNPLYCTNLPPPTHTQLNEPNYQGLVVNHYLFTSWPDHGVPEYATALIGFIRRVRARFNPEKAPLLVHCSAGVGRTGTFIVLDTMLERIKEQSSVNVYQTLQDIRFKRAKMVQTQVSTHTQLSHTV